MCDFAQCSLETLVVVLLWFAGEVLPKLSTCRTKLEHNIFTNMKQKHWSVFKIMVRTYRNPQPGSLGGMFAPGSRPPNGNGFSPDSKVSYKNFKVIILSLKWILHWIFYNQCFVNSLEWQWNRKCFFKSYCGRCIIYNM